MKRIMLIGLILAMVMAIGAETLFAADDIKAGQLRFVPRQGILVSATPDIVLYRAPDLSGANLETQLKAWAMGVRVKIENTTPLPIKKRVGILGYKVKIYSYVDFPTTLEIEVKDLQYDAEGRVIAYTRISREKKGGDVDFTTTEQWNALPDGEQPRFGFKAYSVPANSSVEVGALSEDIRPGTYEYSEIKVGLVDTGAVIGKANATYAIEPSL